jgi:hypothetical protein
LRAADVTLELQDDNARHQAHYGAATTTAAPESTLASTPVDSSITATLAAAAEPAALFATDAATLFATDAAAAGATPRGAGATN